MPSVVRFDPFREITTLREDMNRLFSRTLGDSPGAVNAWSPAVDIFDAPDAIVLKAELPGISPDDIDIEVDDNVLSITGERRFEERVEEGRYHRVERAYGRFQRSVTLPPNVLTEQITAGAENGVLEVRVPKVEEAKPRKISVQAAGGTIDERSSGAA
jgi:HSP20 family protein